MLIQINFKNYLVYEFKNKNEELNLIKWEGFMVGELMEKKELEKTNDMDYKLQQSLEKLIFLINFRT